MVELKGAGHRRKRRPMEINTVDISIEDQSKEPLTGAEVTRNLSNLPVTGMSSEKAAEQFQSNQDIKETSGDLLTGEGSQESPSIATSP